MADVQVARSGILYLAERRVELGYAVRDVLASTTLGAVSVTLVVIGATMPAWGSRVGIPSAYRWLDRRRACRRLYPLWRDLCRAAPDIALDAVPSGLADALVVQDLGFRLYRRVVEIRDGRLAVGTHLPPGVAEHAESMGRDAGLTGNKLHAVVEAGCLRAAIQARSLAYQNSGNPALPPTIGGAEVADEVAFLELVADAYRRSPIVRAVVADLRVDQATR